MKFLPIIAAAMAFSTAPVAASDFDRCVNKAPEVVRAIGELCTILGYKNVVPNSKAGHGHKGHYGGHTAKTTIRSNCNPGQWIPKEFCFDQFYSMCANGDQKGRNAKYFGRNNCQAWYIEN